MVGIFFTGFLVVLAIDKYFWKLISTAKSTYSSLRSSESQSASRFLFFVFSPLKGSHGLIETGDKNRNVTDNMQGRQKNVPKKNAIRGKFVVLLIKPSYYSCFDVLVAAVVLVAKAPIGLSMCVNFWESE